MNRAARAGSSSSQTRFPNKSSPAQTSSDTDTDDSTDELTLIFQAAPTPKPVSRTSKRPRATERVARRQTGDFVVPLHSSTSSPSRSIESADDSDAGVRRISRDQHIELSETSEDEHSALEDDAHSAAESLPLLPALDSFQRPAGISRRSISSSRSPSASPLPSPTRPASSSSSRGLLWPPARSPARVAVAGLSRDAFNSEQPASSPPNQALFNPPSISSSASPPALAMDDDDDGPDEVVLAESPVTRLPASSTPPRARETVRMTFSPVPRSAAETLALGRRAGRVSLLAWEKNEALTDSPKARLAALRARVRSMSPQVQPIQQPAFAPTQAQTVAQASSSPPTMQSTEVQHPTTDSSAQVVSSPSTVHPAESQPPRSLSPAQPVTVLSPRSPSPAKQAARPQPSPSPASRRVIEISSASPRAAAKAAAILKVYGDYVEQGLEPPGSLLRAAGISNPRQDQRLRGLLRSAETRIRRSSSVLSVGHSATPEPSRAGRTRPRLTPTPTSSQAVQPGSGYRNEFPPTSSPGPSSTQSSQIDGHWSRADWRQLEKCLVKTIRRARHERTAVRDERVVERYLLEVGYAPGHEGEGDWSWNKLLARVRALQVRRARESRQNSLQPGGLEPLTSVDEPEDGRIVQVKLEPMDEESEGQLTSDAANESRDPQDDTFFHRQQQPAQQQQRPDDGEDEDEDDETRRERQPSVPLALAGARFAHLFDDEPMEKPPLPDWAVKELRDQRRANGEHVSSSPRPEQAPAQVSSARKLVSWVGGLLSRSIRSPGPDPTSPLVVRVTPAQPNGDGDDDDEEESDDEPALPRLRERSTSSGLSNVIAVASYSSSSSPSQESSPAPIYPSLEESGFLYPPQPDLPVASGSRSRPRGAVQDLSRALPPSPRGPANMVQERIAALEEAESSREEDSRALDNLFGPRAGEAARLKRKASMELARLKSEELPGMVPAGARALDRPIGRIERRRS